MNVNVNIYSCIDQIRLEVVNILCNTLSDISSALRNMGGQLLHLVTCTTLTTTFPSYCCFTVIQNVKEYND